MGFSRQEYWGGLPFPSPGDLPNPGIEPKSLKSPPLSGRFFTTSATWEALPGYEALNKHPRLCVKKQEDEKHGCLGELPFLFGNLHFFFFLLV